MCIAAAGRVLCTVQVHEEVSFEKEIKVLDEDIYSLDLLAVEKAHKQINEKNEKYKFYCVGYTAVKYYLNDYVINNLEGHKAEKIGVDMLATFLPEEVVDSLYSAVDGAGLTVANLTLEPIAAMNVAIPENFRLLNIALVDVGAGTSDICLTKDGSIIAYGMIPMAGDELTEIIAKEYLVDFATAENIKIEASTEEKIIFKDIMGLTQEITSDDVSKLIDEQLNKIACEVADKIIELNGGKAASAVFVVGGGGKYPGFTDKIAMRLGIARERAAVRGKEVLENIDFLMEDVKKDALLVTPVGICINYYNQKNSFIFANVNGERIKLYDNNHLTVVDAIMQSGMPNDSIFPKRGKELVFTINGKTRLVRGSTGDAAIIRLNGREVGMNERLTRNDIIEITPSSAGEDGKITIGELEEYCTTISFIVNGKTIICPKFAYVNDEIKPADYEIKSGDVVNMGYYYKVRQLFDFMDIDISDKVVMVNGVEADYDTLVYEGFEVEYHDMFMNAGTTRGGMSEAGADTNMETKNFGQAQNGKLSDSINDNKIPNADIKTDAGTDIKADIQTYTRTDTQTGAKADIQTDTRTDVKTDIQTDAKIEAKKVHSITVVINGQQVLLSGKTRYTFVDIFDFYPFDLKNVGGIELVTTINGNRADFTEELDNGSVIELYWKK